MKKTVTTIAISIILTTATLITINNRNQKIFSNKMSQFHKSCKTIEKKIINSTPIFSDYKKKGVIKLLRTHLQAEHLKAAIKYGISPLKNDTEVKHAITQKKLVSCNRKANKRLYYFYNVRKKYRFLTPNALKGLDEITNHINKIFSQKIKMNNIQLKIAVSSMVRPSLYQKKLRSRNSNAITVSTHSYGCSFDIFYDDYYIQFPKSTGKTLFDKLYNKERVQIGFLLGDSLRRQLKSILSRTLIELQDAGKLYAIFEKNQHCFHITILR